MSLNPFSAVEDYPGMLNKIAWFNFLGGVLLLLFLYYEIPEINSALRSVLTVDFFGSNVPFLTVLIPFFFASVARIMKLHDRISDLFGIRLRYDTEHILIPMFRKLNVPVDDRISDAIKDRRKFLMKQVFYKYASSTKEKCQIDHHHVTMALDQFAWYWILIEISLLLLIGVVIGFALGDNYVGYGLTFLMVVLLLFAQFIKETFCRKYSEIEIDDILSDTLRTQDVNQCIINFLNGI